MSGSMFAHIFVIVIVGWIRRSVQCTVSVVSVVALALIPAAYGADPPSFESDILPVFKARCLACHSGATPQAKLDLSTRESVVAGGKSGPAVVPGSSEKSLLVEKVLSKVMPPVEPKLTDEQISLIRMWIDKGDAALAAKAPVVVTESDVLPIFQMRCVVCHGKRKQEGGLDLRFQVTRLKGGPKEMYGLNEEATASYGKRCLMARRLVERGVRFVQLFIEYQIWDAHSGLEDSLRYSCGKTDKPAAALIQDLKQRVLLDSTLVIWGGEFGRMPNSQLRQGQGSAGRDHGPSGFSIWMAGGVKAGYVHGATDEMGHKAAENRVSVHDFHATMLHLLGLNFRNLVYERNGLKERLTDQFPARVVSEVLA